MRTSQRKTTVAVHRSLLGIKVADYSGMIGRKTSYLQGIETGRERLTEELALIIEKQTACRTFGFWLAMSIRPHLTR